MIVRSLLPKVSELTVRLPLPRVIAPLYADKSPPNDRVPVIDRDPVEVNVPMNEPSFSFNVPLFEMLSANPLRVPIVNTPLLVIPEDAPLTKPVKVKLPD